MSNTIYIKGQSGRRDERPAAAAGIRPGDLLEIDSTGDYAVHSTATGTAAAVFAVENELEGKDIADNYLVDEQVLAINCNAGDQVLAWLADLEVAVIGSILDSDGDGSLKVVDTAAATADTARASVVGIALEALSPSGADVRIKVEIV